MGVLDRARGLQVWLVMVPLWFFISTHARGWLTSLGMRPLIDLDVSLGWAGLLAVPVATFIAFLWTDFFFYWFHRFQHRYLWRFHSVHHSIENLSAINSYHHWSEAFFWPLLVTMPMMLVTLDFSPRIFIVTFIFALQPTFIHSDTKLHFGKLGWLLVDNRYHRIHHSIEERHFDKNFGAMTPLWDWLFGTLSKPGEGEWPDVGLPSKREARNLWQWAILPWTGMRSSPSPSHLATQIHAGS